VVPCRQAVLWILLRNDILDLQAVNYLPVYTAHVSFGLSSYKREQSSFTQKTVSRCFAVLCQLRQIRRSVQSLVITLVNSRLDYGNGAEIALPVYVTRRLQSVLNAAVQLIFNLRSSDHVSDVLISLHWLRIPERIRSTVAILLFHGCIPSYLSPLTEVADLPSRWWLHSSCSDCLVQPPVHCSTVGSRAFSVAGFQVWNCLPPEVTSAPSLATFCSPLKTFLFTESYPDIQLIWQFVSTHCL